MADQTGLTPATDELAQFALAEAVRTLTEQTGSVRSIKERAITLVGLTATASSFLIGAAIEANPNKTSVWFYIAVFTPTASFCALLLFSALILKPVKDWHDAVGPTTIMDDFDRPNGWRLLAGFYAKAIDSNTRKLTPLGRLLQRATIAAGVTIVSSIVLLWSFG